MRSSEDAHGGGKGTTSIQKSVGWEGNLLTVRKPASKNIYRPGFAAGKSELHLPSSLFYLRDLSFSGGGRSDWASKVDPIDVNRKGEVLSNPRRENRSGRKKKEDTE